MHRLGSLSLRVCASDASEKLIVQHILDKTIGPQELRGLAQDVVATHGHVQLGLVETDGHEQFALVTRGGACTVHGAWRVVGLCKPSSFAAALALQHVGIDF